MALNAGQVCAYLMLDTSGFEKGANSAKSMMGKLKSDSLSASDKLGAVGAAMTSVGSALTKSVTAPLLALGTASVMTFASFDDAMMQVKATMNAGEADMEKLTACAKEMGTNTRYSATEAAEALNYMALAGYDTDTAISALPQVLALAQAGGMDLASASDMATDAISALGLSVDDLTMLSDKMAAASAHSNTSVSQLGDAILTIGANAQTMAGGTSELITQLGLLANNGIKGSEAGTALRNVLKNLQTPTDAAAKAMKSIGLECYDAEGNFRNTVDIMADLNEKLEGMSEQEQNEILGQIFDTRTIAAARTLMAGAMGDFEQLLGYVDNSAGETQRMADTMESGIGGAMRSLKSAVEGAAIAFGEALAPTVQSVAEVVTNLARGFAGLSAGTQSTIATIGMVAAAVGPVLIVLGKLTSAVSSIMAFSWGPVALGIAGVTAAVVALGAAYAAAARNMDPFQNSIDKTTLANAQAGFNVGVSTTITSNETDEEIKKKGEELCQHIVDVLTDGMPDTPEEIQGLLDQTKKYFSDLVDQVNAAADAEIANLDVNSATYEEDCKRIKTKAAETVASLKTQEEAATKWIESMAGKSAKYVKQHIGELEEILGKVVDITAAINKATGNTPSMKVVKQGLVTDETTAGKAFGEASSIKASKNAQNKGQYDARMAILNDRYAQGNMSDDTYKSLAKRYGDAWTKTNEEITAEYNRNILELTAGLGQSLAVNNPEMAAQVESALSGFDLMDMLENSDSLDVTKMTEGMKEKLVQAFRDIGGDPEKLFGSDSSTWAQGIADMFNAGDIEFDQLRDEAERSLKDDLSTLDLGFIDEVMKTNIENGVYTGVDGIDLSSLEGKMRALFSNGTGTVQLPVEPEVTEVDVNVNGDTKNLDSAIKKYQGKTIVLNVTQKVRQVVVGSSSGGGGGGGYTEQKNALGGRVSVASIFGEAGPEWAIPEKHTSRTAALLVAAAKAAGFTWEELMDTAGMSVETLKGSVPTLEDSMVNMSRAAQSLMEGGVSGSMGGMGFAGGADQSAGTANARGVSINIGEMHVRSESDISKIGNRLAAYVASANYMG